jgi:biopolymer transport protein ExbB/TolQ
MMKNEARFWRWGIWGVFILSVVIALVFKYDHDGSFALRWDANTYINLAFFTFVFVIFLIATILLSKGDGLVMKIKAMRKQILTIKMSGSNSKELIDKIRSGDIRFNETSLDEALDRYKIDVEDMLKASENTYLEIDSYINNAIVDKRIQIHFLNQIAGTMTGLGILGTFIGLSVGLNSFSLSGTSADITNKIQPLMEGIKVAFHTSIYGIIYSIGFNFFYRQVLSKYHDEVSLFLLAFHQYVVPISDNGTESTLIKYLQKMEELLKTQIDDRRSKNDADAEMNKTLNRNLESINDTLSQTQTLVGNMSEEISGRFTNMMNDVVVPEIRKMGQIVEEFAKSTQKDQVEELSRLVDAFIQDMNNSLGSSFEQLGSIIKETNEWQKRSLEEMQNILEKVNDTTVDLVTIDDMVEKAIENISKYTDEVEKMQEAANRNLESLNVQVDLNNEIVQSQTEKLAEINEKQATMQNSVIEAMKQVEECSEKISETISNIGELSDEVIGRINQKIDEVDEFDGQVLEDISEAADRLGSAAAQINENLQEKITETFVGFDRELANICSHLAGVLSQMERVSNRTKTSYEGISLEIQDIFKSLQEKLQEYLEITDKMHHDLSTKRDYYRQISLEEK